MVVGTGSPDLNTILLLSCPGWMRRSLLDMFKVSAYSIASCSKARNIDSSCGVAIPNSKVSSAYSMSNIGLPTDQVFVGVPVRSSRFSVSCIRTVRSKINKYGLRGQPCRIPEEACAPFIPTVEN